MTLDEARAAFKSRDDAARTRAVEAIVAGEVNIDDLELGKHQYSVVSKRVREVRSGGGSSAQVGSANSGSPNPGAGSTPAGPTAGIPDEFPHTAELTAAEQRLPDGPALLVHHPKTCGPCEDCRQFLMESGGADLLSPLAYKDGSPVPRPTAAKLLRHAERFSSGQAVLDTAKALGIRLTVPAGTPMHPPKRNHGRIIPSPLAKKALSV